ncbi:putative sulfate exporter family transporter [Paenarthrobacter sp. DKR-5]|uniref:YeiH family protein n=1 Tax=Paenarthrobacter sp. DKR-5 TaxID=2835535 RepID=UPI0027DCC6CA|nr:putative sulfate exporter family transporter [Paenarthrobacter sp. DKR-5]
MKTQTVDAHTGAGNPGRGLPAVLPGLALAVGIAIAATLAGRLVPVLGGPVAAIVLGVLLAALLKPGGRLLPGIGVAGRFVLQLSVVLLGSQLSLPQVAQVGLESLPVMLGTLAVCLAAAFWLGRLLGVTGDLRTLIGVGTGICGASAIAAATPVIGAVGADVAYAVSTIFLFNVAAVVLFPLLGHLLGMSQHAFGLFAGTAVNDMSSVVAAATTFGPEAANYAVVVKLVRTLMIIPICLGLSVLVARRARIAAAVGEGAAAADTPRKPRLLRLVPWFLIGFVVVAALNSAGLVPAPVQGPLREAATFMITVAMAGVGLSTNLRAFRRAGAKPLLLGGALWVVVSLTSLGLQALSGS